MKTQIRQRHGKKADLMSPFLASPYHPCHVSIKNPFKPACLASPGQTLGCADSPAACQSPAPDTHSWTSNPLLPTCLQAAHPTSLPSPATGSSAQLPSKNSLWESHCMTFWPKYKAIRLGKVLPRRLFYCCGPDITGLIKAMLLPVLLTNHDCHLTLTAA